MSVIGPIAHAAGAVDGNTLCVAEAAHVGRDDPVLLRRARHQVLEKAAGREVAVDHDHRDPVLRSGLDVAHAQPAGLDGFAFHSGGQIHGFASSVTGCPNDSGRLAGAAQAGRVRVNVLPSPGRDSAVSSPPCRSAISRLRYSPRPVPAMLTFSSSVGRRPNLVKRRPAWSRAMPIPWSATSTDTCPSFRLS